MTWSTVRSIPIAFNIHTFIHLFTRRVTTATLPYRQTRRSYAMPLPIPGLDHLSDDTIFSFCSYVVCLPWLVLLFAPK